MDEEKVTGPGDVPGRDRLPVTLSIWVGLIAYVVYMMTLSPGVSWAHHSEDSGDLITAAYLLGIPHPTGYPLFCIMGWIWSHVFVIGSVAWRMNALSALFGAIAAAVTVRAVWSSFDLLPFDSFRILTRFSRGLASLASGLVLAFATDVWKLSVVTEVYSLNLFFIALLSWILIELMVGAKSAVESGSDWTATRGKLLVLLGLSWGFALTNHLTSLFLLPSILIILAFGQLGITLKEFLRSIGFFILPLLLYFYIPIRSAMNPPLDWGNPENLTNFIWVVTGSQFKKLMFTLSPYQMLHQIMRYGQIPVELGGPGALAAGLGVCRLILGKNRWVILLLIHTMLLVGSSLFYLASYYIWDPEGYLLPMIWAGSMWAGWSLALMINVPSQAVKLGRILGVILLIIAPIWALVGHWDEVDLSGTRDAIRFAEEGFESYEENALVLEVRYERAFALWYYREIEYADTRDDVDIIFVEHATFDWGLDLLRRKVPDLVLPDEPLTGGEVEAAMAAWLIRNNIGRRPIYIGATVDELAEEGYRFEGVGLSFLVHPPEIP